MRIKSKILFWFLLPSIFIAATTAVFSYIYIQKTVRQNIFDQLEIAAYEGREHVQFYLQEKKRRTIDSGSDGLIREYVGEIIRRDDKVQYYTDRLNTYLAVNKQPLDPDILAMFIVDLTGRIISSTEIDQIGKDVSDDDYFSKTMKKGSYICDLSYIAGSKQNTSFDVARLLLSKDNQTSIAIIVNRYNGDSLRKLTRGEVSELEQEGAIKGLGKTGELYIVNSDKLMITESRFVKNAILKQVVDTEGVRATFENGEGMIGIYPDYRGVSILGVSKYIEEMDWVIVAEKDVSEAFAPITRLRNFIIIMSITGVIVIVTIAILLSRGITNPIKVLIRGTKKIAEGDLEQPIVVGKGKDEVKELGDSFNLMMDKLRRSNERNAELLLEIKKRSESEWQNTFDVIDDIITVHDKDFRIVKANRAFFERFNITKEQLTGKKCYEIFHGTNEPWHNCPLKKTAGSLRPECEEVDDPNMGGVFLISTYPLFNDKGEYYGTVHQAKDITHQKELQRQYINKANELESVNEELEDLVYITSHDLKEPLFAISSYVSKLSGTYKDKLDEKGRAYIERVSVNMEIMYKRINDVMEVIKAGRVIYNFKDSNSATIIEEVTKELESKINSNKIKLSIQDNLPTVKCDARSLRDIFLNLIANAIKFIGNDGQRLIRIGSSRYGDCCKFYVEDTGIGIQKEYHEQVFKMFRRLNEIEVDGTGAGLALVKNIVKINRGKIWIESPVEKGRGTRFCFTIPLAKREDQTTKPRWHKASTNELVDVC